VELKVVIDTNVLVSGLLKRGTPPAEVIADLLEGDLRVLYDGRIIDEYGEVLARPKFKIPQDRVRDLLDFVVGEEIVLEIKSVEHLVPVYHSQLLNYMRVAHLRVGLLMNFNVVVLRDGLKREIL